MTHKIVVVVVVVVVVWKITEYDHTYLQEGEHRILIQKELKDVNGKGVL